MTRHRNVRMTPRPTPRPTLTTEQAYDLGDQLIEALTPLAGNGLEVDRVLTAWTDRHDVFPFSMAALAALRTVFAECLTRVPLDDLPPGSLHLTKGLTHD